MFYVVDVIGILKHKEAKREYVNENKEDKTQLKFSITDGRYIQTNAHTKDFTRVLPNNV